MKAEDTGKGMECEGMWVCQQDKIWKGECGGTWWW
jgi:hypothetical protein